MCTMTPEREAEIRARCEAATKDWRVHVGCEETPDEAPSHIWFARGPCHPGQWRGEARKQAYSDAEFAAYASTDLPDALDALDVERKAHAETKRDLEIMTVTAATQGTQTNEARAEAKAAKERAEWLKEELVSLTAAFVTLSTRPAGYQEPEPEARGGAAQPPGVRP